MHPPDDSCTPWLFLFDPKSSRLSIIGLDFPASSPAILRRRSCSVHCVVFAQFGKHFPLSFFLCTYIYGEFVYCDKRGYCVELVKQVAEFEWKLQQRQLFRKRTGSGKVCLRGSESWPLSSSMVFYRYFFPFLVWWFSLIPVYALILKIWQWLSFGGLTFAEGRIRVPMLIQSVDRMKNWNLYTPLTLPLRICNVISTKTLSRPPSLWSWICNFNGIRFVLEPSNMKNMQGFFLKAGCSLELKFMLWEGLWWSR